MKVAVYYPSWNAPWAGDVHNFELAKIDEMFPGVNWVYLAFAKPDMVYIKGQNSWAGTGLDFSMDFQVVKEAVALLRSRNICVMLSVGGATYWTSDRELKQVAVRDLVADLGLNGVDIDFEVAGQPQRLTSICRMMRDALPKECYLSMAGKSAAITRKDAKHPED